MNAMKFITVVAVTVLGIGWIYGEPLYAQDQGSPSDPLPVVDFGGNTKATIVEVQLNNAGGAEVLSSSVVYGFPRSHLGDPPMLDFQSFHAWNPLEVSVHGEDGHFVSVADEAVGRFVVPFFSSMASMAIFDLQRGEQLIEVDLQPAIDSFCQSNPQDPDCEGEEQDPEDPTSDLQRVAAALDNRGNSDGLLNSDETLDGIRFWVNQTPVEVAGGETIVIDSDMMLALVSAWVSETPIDQLEGTGSASAAALGSLASLLTGGQPEPLSLRRVSAQWHAQGQIEFEAEGTGIRSTDIDVFDLSGQVVYSSEAQGRQSLTWNLLNTNHRPVANGVYLYVATVRGANGQVQRSAVKKLVVLR